MGKVFPWYFKILKTVLFPLEAYDEWRRYNKQTGYDFYRDTLCINGNFYDRKIFYNTFQEGKIWKITRTENGILTVEDLTKDYAYGKS